MLATAHEARSEVSVCCLDWCRARRTTSSLVFLRGCISIGTIPLARDEGLPKLGPHTTYTPNTTHLMRACPWRPGTFIYWHPFRVHYRQTCKKLLFYQYVFSFFFLSFFRSCPFSVKQKRKYETLVRFISHSSTRKCFVNLIRQRKRYLYNNTVVPAYGLQFPISACISRCPCVCALNHGASCTTGGWIDRQIAGLCLE